MKRRLLVLLIIALLTIACNGPEWANWKLVFRDSEGDLVYTVYCEVYRLEGIADVYCVQPSKEKHFTIPENGTMDAYSIEHAIP